MKKGIVITSYSIHYTKLYEFSQFIFNSLDMTAAQTLDLAAELEIPSDLFISKNSEAVNYSGRFAYCPDNFIRGEVSICFMGNSKYYRIRVSQSLVKILLHPYLLKLLLITEEL